MKKIVCVLLASSAILFASCKKEKQAGIAGSVSTNGSTSMSSVISILSEDFMAKNPNVAITYDPTGSGAGIESVSTGNADIGLASRGLKDKERSSGLQSTTLALDGIAIIVNKANALNDITLADLSKVFTGEITNWKTLGGDDLEIANIGREAGSGTRDGFESITKTGGKCKLQSELTSTGAVISSVANNKNAIGYASLSAVENQSDIKALKVEGIFPTEASVQDGSYKIQRPFILVTKQASPLSKTAQAFFDYMTSGDRAVDELVKKAGAVPIVR